MPRDPHRDLDFRRSARSSDASAGRMLILLAVLVLVTIGLMLRAAWEPRVPEGTLVEVVGDVPRPGFHRLDEPTLAAAVEAAGGDAAGLADTPLHEGDRVVVSPDGVRVAPSGDPLLVALPVDVNTADVTALQAVPGIGPSTARAIVEDRKENGPFYAIEDLARVKGLGAETVRDIESFLTVGDVGPRPPPQPIDLNTASARELERLPGIGPVTAARIVVDREDHGPYGDLDDLQRVKGIGPKTVEGLEGLAVAGDGR